MKPPRKGVMSEGNELWATWQRHEAVVRGHLRKRLGRLPDDEEAMLVSRVFELFAASHGRAPPGCERARWLFGIAHNVVRERRRKVARRRRLEEAALAEAALVEAGGDRAPSAEVRQLARDVERSLARYHDPRAARAWWRRVVHEEELVDIARQSAVSLATVKRWIEAVRGWLRGAFAQAASDAACGVGVG